ncbi:hypothetical protein EDB89DRAFT_1911497 [Lactarius sanguifluus]|nr:hypothetical protein EDB89DRAFT_1911497 [Lactarius sanguifluus]
MYDLPPPSARAASVALPAASGRGRGGRRRKYKYRTHSGGGECVACRTHVEGLLECGPAWRPFWGRSHGAARYAPRRIVRSPQSSVFEKSSQTSGAGEGTAEGADRRMPKGARSVSKLILAMSVSAILGSAWVGGAMKNWPAPVCSSQACEKHALTWVLGVQTGSWSRTGGMDKNSGHAMHGAPVQELLELKTPNKTSAWQALYKLGSLLSNVQALPTPSAGHAGGRGCQGGRKPVTSRAVEYSTTECCNELRKLVFLVMVGDRDLTSSQSFGTSRNSNRAYSIGTYRSCCMITNRTLALLRLAPTHLLDQLAEAPNQVMRVKHEQYGGSEWDVDSCVNYPPSLRLGAVSRVAETEWNGSVARRPRKYSVLAMRQCNVSTLEPLTALLEKVRGWRQTTTHHFYEHEHEPLFLCLATASSTSWRGPSQVVHIKHEQNVGLVGNLAQLAYVVPTRLLFHLAAPDRDTAERISCMAVVDVSHASDESVGSGAIIASLCRGSRGEGWADRIGGGKVGCEKGWRVEPAVVFERNTSDRKSGQRRSRIPMSLGEQNTLLRVTVPGMGDAANFHVSGKTFYVSIVQGKPQSVGGANTRANRFVGFLEKLQLFLHLAAPGRCLLRHSGWDVESHVSSLHRYVSTRFLRDENWAFEEARRDEVAVSGCRHEREAVED